LNRTPIHNVRGLARSTVPSLAIVASMRVLVTFSARACTDMPRPIGRLAVKSSVVAARSMRLFWSSSYWPAT
jgi:hypothetical protein